MRTPSRSVLSLVVALGLLGASCGGLSTGSSGVLLMQVDGDPADPDDVVLFQQALQLPVSHTISLRNIGLGDDSLVTITSVDWDRDDEGNILKNQHIELDFLGGGSSSTFPFDLPPDLTTLTFGVKYTPPLGVPLADFSDSVLLIKTKGATTEEGKKLGDVRLTFHINSESPAPRVSPTSFTFRNATPSSPESQDITIYNDEQLGNGQFAVTGITLQNSNPEFVLSNLPSQGAVVLGRNNEGYRDIVFRVTYTPTDNTPDSNSIIISTDDPQNPQLTVTLNSGTIRGSYELSFNDPNELDFSNINTKTERQAVVASLGPGPITIRQPGPTIEPAEARRDFKVTGFVPNGEVEGDPITNWPRALASGKSLLLKIEYTPRTDGTDSANGELIIPYGDPDAQEIHIPLFSGDPKSKIVLCPSTGNISVTGGIVAGDSGDRNLCVYNEGNGPLQVKGLELFDAFQDAAQVWSTKEAFAPFTVQPGGIHIIVLHYDLAEIDSQDGSENESAKITYFDDYTGQDESVTMGLIASDDDGKADAVAAIAPTSGTVGEAVELSGAGSNPGGGTFEGNAYIWYIIEKPAGSFAKLNLTSGATTSFVPDVAGTYKVELVVFSKATDDLYLSSAPATVTIEVAP